LSGTMACDFIEILKRHQPKNRFATAFRPPPAAMTGGGISGSSSTRRLPGLDERADDGGVRERAEVAQLARVRHAHGHLRTIRLSFAEGQAWQQGGNVCIRRGSDSETGSKAAQHEAGHDTLRSTRRMILPERVLGRLGAQCTTSGTAKAPISLRTRLLSSLASSSVISAPSMSVTKA